MRFKYNIECPNGCTTTKFSIISHHLISKLLQSSLDLHLQFECPFRSIKCELCMQLIHADNLETHKEIDCMKRKVPCDLSHCNYMESFDQIDNHKKYYCQCRTVLCAQGCGNSFPLSDLGLHMLNTCKNRKIKCYECEKDILYIDLKCHQSISCKKIKKDKIQRCL